MYEHYPQYPYDPELMPPEPEADVSYQKQPQPFILNQKQLDQLATYWVEAYGGTGKNFSAQQEQLLAEHIQTGLRIQEETRGSRISQHDADLITRGQKAEQALVENNLRFAFMYARESVGLKHPGTLQRFIAAQAASPTDNSDDSAANKPQAKLSRPQRYFGTYRPLSSLRSPRASLEDRHSISALSLVEAVRKFQANQQAKFTTYAPWRLQGGLDRGVAETEHSGIRLSVDKAALIAAYFGEYPTVEPNHSIPDEIAHLLRTQEITEFPYEFTERKVGSPEDLNDPWGEDDVASDLSEVWDDPNETNSFYSVDAEIAHDFIDKAFKTVSEREAGVMSLRFGLGDAAYTYDEISKVYGVSRERIRQIEMKTMSQLRSDTEQRELLANAAFMLYGDSSGLLPVPTVWRGDTVHLPQQGTTHMELPSQTLPDERQDPDNAGPVITEEDRALAQEQELWVTKESWQVYPGEEWDTSIRTNSEALPTDALALRVAEALENTADYYFNRQFGRHDGLPYPMAPMRLCREIIGEHRLSPEQLTQIWDSFLIVRYQRLATALKSDFYPDRIGQLFSQLIAENIREADEPVDLTIPEFASGQIGYLAGNLSRGTVHITGTPGDYVALRNHGTASVVVYGDCGDHAGAVMSERATLEIVGTAGYGLGVGMHDEARITAERALSVSTSSPNIVVQHRHFRY